MNQLKVDYQDALCEKRYDFAISCALKYFETSPELFADDEYARLAYQIYRSTCSEAVEYEELFKLCRSLDKNVQSRAVAFLIKAGADTSSVLDLMSDVTSESKRDLLKVIGKSQPELELVKSRLMAEKDARMRIMLLEHYALHSFDSEFKTSYDECVNELVSYGTRKETAQFAKTAIIAVASRMKRLISDVRRWLFPILAACDALLTANTECSRILDIYVIYPVCAQNLKTELASEELKQFSQFLQLLVVKSSRKFLKFDEGEETQLIECGIRSVSPAAKLAALSLIVSREDALIWIKKLFIASFENDSSDLRKNIVKMTSDCVQSSQFWEFLLDNLYPGASFARTSLCLRVMEVINISLPHMTLMRTKMCLEFQCRSYYTSNRVASMKLMKRFKLMDEISDVKLDGIFMLHEVDIISEQVRLSKEKEVFCAKLIQETQTNIDNFLALHLANADVEQLYIALRRYPLHVYFYAVNSSCAIARFSSLYLLLDRAVALLNNIPSFTDEDGEDDSYSGYITRSLWKAMRYALEIEVKGITDEREGMKLSKILIHYSASVKHWGICKTLPQLLCKLPFNVEERIEYCLGLMKEVSMDRLDEKHSGICYCLVQLVGCLPERESSRKGQQIIGSLISCKQLGPLVILIKDQTFGVYCSSHLLNLIELGVKYKSMSLLGAVSDLILRKFESINQAFAQEGVEKYLIENLIGSCCRNVRFWILVLLQQVTDRLSKCWFDAILSQLNVTDWGIRRIAASVLFTGFKEEFRLYVEDLCLSTCSANLLHSIIAFCQMCRICDGELLRKLIDAVGTSSNVALQIELLRLLEDNLHVTAVFDVKESDCYRYRYHLARLRILQGNETFIDHSYAEALLDLLEEGYEVRLDIRNLISFKFQDKATNTIMVKAVCKLATILGPTDTEKKMLTEFIANNWKSGCSSIQEALARLSGYIFDSFDDIKRILSHADEETKAAILASYLKTHELDQDIADYLVGYIAEAKDCNNLKLISAAVSLTKYGDTISIDYPYLLRYVEEVSSAKLRDLLGEQVLSDHPRPAPFDLMDDRQKLIWQLL